MDRTIHFGDDAADARYRIQDTSSTGGDFVLAEDLDGGTVLLEYDYSASEWVSRGPVNLSGNDITNAGSISAAILEATGAVINDEYHYASKYDGSDPDSRLSNALSSASMGDVIYLENGDYNVDRTISTSITLSGTAKGFTGTNVTANWTFDSYAKIQNISNTTITLNEINSSIESCNNVNVTINHNRCRVVGCADMDVTFSSGTTVGIADALAESTVTDNGTNTVGDIA